MSQENKDKQAVRTTKIAKGMQPLFEMIRQDIEKHMEIYKPIPNTNDRYFVSNLGNVKTFKKYSEGLVLSPRIDGGGYQMVNLWHEEKRKTYRLHILV